MEVAGGAGHAQFVVIVSGAELYSVHNRVQLAQLKIVVWRCSVRVNIMTVMMMIMLMLIMILINMMMVMIVIMMMNRS